jgi:hypothetical protein
MEVFLQFFKRSVEEVEVPSIVSAIFPQKNETFDKNTRFYFELQTIIIEFII